MELSDREIRSRAVQYAVQLLAGGVCYPVTCCSDPIPKDTEEDKSCEGASFRSIKDLQDDVLTLADSFLEFIRDGKAL